MYYGLLIGSAEFFQLAHTSCKLPNLMFVYILEVGLTQEMSSQLLSGIDPVPGGCLPPFAMGLELHPLSSESF